MGARRPQVLHRRATRADAGWESPGGSLTGGHTAPEVAGLGGIRCRKQ